MADLEKIVEELSSLSVLEASELSKLLEEKWGVSAAAPVAMAAAPAAGGEAARHHRARQVQGLVQGRRVLRARDAHGAPHAVPSRLRRAGN